MGQEKTPPSKLSSAGVSGASRPRFGEVTIHDRGRLPHWEKKSATYFITFRLADSLPNIVLDRIESERSSIVLTARQLEARCVMPNHVDAVIRSFPSESLASVVHSRKSLSAKKANLIRGAAGAFWQREYYDHLVRDENEFEHAVQYVAENPTKVGLRDWRCGQDAHTTAAGTAALPKSVAAKA
jgi:putative DNA methylase